MKPKPLDDAVRMLLLEQPFWASLILRLDRQRSTDYSHMATDGNTLWINPEWEEKAYSFEIKQGLAEAAAHCGLLHPYRGDGLEDARWQFACHQAIGHLLRDSKLLKNSDHLQDEFKNLTAEQIYNQLPPQAQQPQQSSMTVSVVQNNSESGSGSESKGGGIQNSEMDWTIALQSAVDESKRRGEENSSANAALMLQKVPPENWVEILREYVETTSKNDYDWRKPNRKYIPHDLYMPHISSRDQFGTFVIAVDTSGSTAGLIHAFISKINGILEDCNPEKIIYIQCDNQIQNVSEIDQGDLIDAGEIKGFGGTSFVPVFDYIKKMDEQAACLIYFTDLDGDHCDDPSIPVFWCVPKGVSFSKPPYGNVIEVDLK